jgi:hypothetical protein
MYLRTSCVSEQLDIGANFKAKTAHLRTPSSRPRPYRNPQPPRSPTYPAVSTDSYPAWVLDPDLGLSAEVVGVDADADIAGPGVDVDVGDRTVEFACLPSHEKNLIAVDSSAMRYMMK